MLKYLKEKYGVGKTARFLEYHTSKSSIYVVKALVELSEDDVDVLMEIYERSPEEHIKHDESGDI